MYRILIVEDEADAAKALYAALERYGEEHQEEFQIAWMKNTNDLDAPAFDLIFMDIDLGVENGMQAAAELRTFDKKTPLIFVTNLAQYAVQGYQVSALDFIVKPFIYGSFSLRMDRAMEVLHEKRDHAITLKTKDGLRIFPASSIIQVWVKGHNVNYALDDGTCVVARGSPAETEQMLGGVPFLRISSGSIINMAHVRGVHDSEIILSDGSSCYISRANKRHCLEAISRYLGGGAA